MEGTIQSTAIGDPIMYHDLHIIIYFYCSFPSSSYTQTCEVSCHGDRNLHFYYPIQKLLMLLGKKFNKHASHLIKIGFLDKHNSPVLIRKTQNDGQLLKPGYQKANLQYHHVHLQIPQNCPLSTFTVMLGFRSDKCC